MLEILKRNSVFAGAALLLLISLSGCGSMATRKDFYDSITVELQARNYEAAAAGLESAKEDGKFGEKDRFVYYVDAGLAYNYAGFFDSSNQRFHQAEIAAEDLFTKSISKAAVSLLLNDNALEYAGEDYEILYTNLISALNYIALDKIDDAFVEIKRANLKLELLEQKYAEAAAMFQRGAEEDTVEVQVNYEAKPVRFYNSAFGRYLSMRMYAADGKFDDARIDFDYLKQAFSTQPFIYDFEIPELKYQADEGALLSVVALAGLAPVKEALNLRIRTDKQLNLVQILYTDPERQDEEYGHLPMDVSEDYYFKFALPSLQDRPSVISHANVYTGDQQLGRLQLLEDVGKVARETFEAKSSLIYIRSVVRAVAKGLTAHKQKKKADDGGLGGWLKKAAIDVVTDLSENADLRCSRLLPGRILVGDFELVPGSYDLTVEFVGYDGEVVDIQQFPQFQVLQSGLNMIEAVSLN
jgi:hypothetical protein